MRKLFSGILDLLAAPFLALAAVLLPKKRKLMIFGPVPIINNKYWSRALRKAGFETQTLMDGFYPSINKPEDYDLYFDNLVPGWIRPAVLRKKASLYFAFLYLIRNARVAHFPFSGGPLGETILWRLEAFLIRRAGIKTVLVPYGADAYQYSKITDNSLKNALLLSYPEAAGREAGISRRVGYWARHADVMIPGFMMDGVGRWDIPMNNLICLDLAEWKCKSDYSSHDGMNGAVRVLHTPNHRGFKGTEFLARAVEELRAEGLKVELVLLEKVQNEKVREIMPGLDILAEQFIFTGFGLNAMEGMASGLPVLSNLENENSTRIFRRYAFLDECPIVSTSPENLKENLRALVRHPELRRVLGQAGRSYVEKYHSEEAAQYLFGAIYARILEGRNIDLMNLFHPLKSEYNRRKPSVRHPLIENRLPAKFKS